jgi:hypothetical protein
MTRDSIIELADKWTERKGKQFDLQKLYELACQHVCKQNRFWWRKKYITFSLVVSTKTYDLTAITTTPTLTETGIEEIVKWNLVTTTGPSVSFPEIQPVFDDEAIFSMLEATVNVQPSRYVMGVDGLQTLRIDPPDQAYSTRLTFWGMPNFSNDSTITAVPLIPDWHHNAIVENMAAEILENTYGLQDIKATTMRARYQATLQDMQMRPRFTTNYVQSLASQEGAVRST